MVYSFALYTFYVCSVPIFVVLTLFQFKVNCVQWTKYIYNVATPHDPAEHYGKIRSTDECPLEFDYFDPNLCDSGQ